MYLYTRNAGLVVWSPKNFDIESQTPEDEGRKGHNKAGALKYKLDFIFVNAHCYVVKCGDK